MMIMKRYAPLARQATKFLEHGKGTHINQILGIQISLLKPIRTNIRFPATIQYNSTHRYSSVRSNCIEWNNDERHDRNNASSFINDLNFLNLNSYFSKRESEKAIHSTTRPSYVTNLQPGSLFISNTLHHLNCHNHHEISPISHLKPNIIARYYHRSTRNDKVSVALGLGAVALTAKAGQYAVQAYQEYKNSQPEEPVQDQTNTTESRAQDQSQKEKSKQQQTKTEGKSKDGNSSSAPRKNIFQEWFGIGVGAKYYEGGFEEKMTRREAALILGVRESSTGKRIKEAHRRILILNHPDTGGSTYIASKINEAKELLLKGKEGS